MRAGARGGPARGDRSRASGRDRTAAAPRSTTTATRAASGGSMQDEFLVHTREGEPCPRCGRAIRRIVVGGPLDLLLPRLPGSVAPARAARRRRTWARTMASSRPAEASRSATGPTRRPDRLHGCDSAAGSRCGVDVRGGGPGTRETDVIGPLAGAHEASAVAALRGQRLRPRRRRRRRPLARGARAAATRLPAGLVPIVPAGGHLRPCRGGPRRAARDPSRAMRPARRRPRAFRSVAGSAPGSGAAVGKILGRERGDSGRGRLRRDAAPAAERSSRCWRSSTPSATCSTRTARCSAGPRGEDGATLSSAGSIAAMSGPARLDGARGAKHDPGLRDDRRRRSTRPACARIARMAGGGVARAVDPVFSDVDGDVVFCLSSGAAARGPLSGARGRHRWPRPSPRRRSATPSAPPDRGDLVIVAGELCPLTVSQRGKR